MVDEHESRQRFDGNACHSKRSEVILGSTVSTISG